MPHPYGTHQLPKDPSECAEAQLILDLAIRLRARLEEKVPDARHAREAVNRLDQAVMVALGAFHVSPRHRRH